jgi:hypothetical protein
MKFPVKMRARTVFLILIGFVHAVKGQESAVVPSGVISKEELPGFFEKLIGDSQKHAYQRKTSAEHPLRKAELCADGLGGDLEALGESQIEIVKGWFREGQREEAEWLASQMAGPAKPRVHAVLALESARAGRKDQASEQLRLAEGDLHQAKGVEAEQIRGIFAEVKSLLGEEEEVEKFLGLVGEVEKLEVETRLLSLDSGRTWTLQEAEERLRKMDEKLKTNRLAAQFLVGCAGRQLRAGNTEEGLRLVHGAGKLATADGLPSDQRVLVSVAKTAWDAGDKPAAKKAMNVFLACVEKWSDEGAWKAPFLCEGLEVLLEWGDKETVVAWLRTAREGLPKVYVLDNAKSALAVAGIAEKLEGPEAGDALALQAAKAGMVHPHERGRASTGVLVCLYYAKAGRVVPGSIWEVINPAARGEER